jgi:hypothetical protein
MAQVSRENMPRYEANYTSIYGPDLKNASKKGVRITKLFVTTPLHAF